MQLIKNESARWSKHGQVSKHRPLAIGFILLLTGMISFGQGPIPQTKLFDNPVSILSPDAASLGKYGSYGVNHYTGQPGISIPVYEIKEPGISIPISVSYDAGGFIPNKNSSQVGQNWSISAGGAITRTVRGVPDDFHDYNSSGSCDELMNYDMGYIYGVQHNTSYPTQSEIENLSFLDNTINPACGHPSIATSPPNNVLYEYSPDIFSFSFVGHTGSFVMGNDGVVKVSSDQRYKVDLTNFGETYDIVNTWAGYTIAEIKTKNDLSRIVMTAEDGYKFYFGGSISSLEVSFSFFNTTGVSVNGKTGVINAWYLTKIEAPDGTNVNFDYGTYTDAEASTLRNLGSPNGSWFDNELNFMDIRLGQSSKYTNYNFGSYIGTGNDYLSAYNKSLIKMVYLKKIETRLQEVTFSYARKNGTDKPLYAGFENYTTNPNKYFSSKLTSITAKDKIGLVSPLINNLDDLSTISVKTFNFLYEDYGNGTIGYRCYLRELQANGSNYIFDYSRTLDLPHSLTTGIDRWGYYNGQNSNQYFLKYDACPPPGNPLDYEVNFNCTGQVRTTDPTKVDIGMLKSITYPTGGKTEFEFEANRFKKILKRKPTAPNPVIPVQETLSQEDYAGGCRIKKIINTPGFTTEYKYIKNYEVNPSGESSGFLIDFDIFKFRHDHPSNGYFYEAGFSDNISKAGLIGEPHITYPEVVEIVHDGSNGFTKYIYTNHDDVAYTAPTACPDNYYLGASSLALSPNPLVTNTNKLLKKFAKVSSRSAERGKVSKVEVYANGNSTPLKTTEYTYNTDPLRFNEKTSGYEKIFSALMPGSLPAYLIQGFQIYHYHNKVTKVTEKTNSSGQLFTQITEYAYKSNSNSLITEVKTTGSDNRISKTLYYYPEDKMSDPAFPASTGMVNRFIVAPVVEEKTYKGSTHLTTQQKIYSDVTGSGGYKLSNTKAINHTVTGSTLNSIMNIGYYTDGMVKEISKLNDIKTMYIWDYKKSFPIAEVTNAVSATDIAYTSFETNETWTTGGYNQWIYNSAAAVTSNGSFTGSRYHNLTGNNVTRSLSPSQTYILSCWFKGSSLSVSGLSPINGETIKGWAYKQYLVTGLSSVTISGTGQLDELRLYPAVATMRTFNYQPIIGLLNESDVNNSTRYFSYDGYGRLSLIWNKYQELEKKICYNYYGQQEECALPCDPNSQPTWQNTGNVRCQLNSSCGYTGYQEVEQMNTNTCIASIQNQWVLGPYNPTACSSSGLSTLYIQNNAGISGLTLKITKTQPIVSLEEEEYLIPAVSGSITCIKRSKNDLYNIEITNDGVPINLSVTISGTTVTGTPAVFNNIPFHFSNIITIDY